MNMPSLLDCLSDCQPKVRSDLMSFLNITSNELEQETALLREVGLNIREENEVYQLVPEMPLLNPQAISTALSPYSVHYHRTISSTNEFITNQINQLKNTKFSVDFYLEDQNSIPTIKKMGMLNDIYIEENGGWKIFS